MIFIQISIAANTLSPYYILGNMLTVYIHYHKVKYLVSGTGKKAKVLI